MIEQEDANLKGSGNYLENPLAAKIAETEEGIICAELIRDFLEYYKMDYTLQVFVPECNLPTENKMKGRLGSQLGLMRDDKIQNTPLLAMLVQQQIRSLSSKPNIIGSPLSPPSDAFYNETEQNLKTEQPVSPSPVKPPPQYDFF